LTPLEEKYADRYDPKVAQAMVDNDRKQPGLPEYLGMAITDNGPGWCHVDLEVTEELLNPFGAAHGAVVASIIDHALGSAVFPLVPLGTWPATLEFKVNYLAPARPGRLRARAEVVSISSRTAVVGVECTNGERAVATALGTIALVPQRT
jgi:uncharacterized protein (TIGR00369 family)